MQLDETELIRTVESEFQDHSLSVRTELRFVDDAPGVVDIWFDGDDEEWPEILVSYIAGSEDARIIIGDFTFESVSYGEVPVFLRKMFLGDYKITESRKIFGRQRLLAVEVSGQVYASSFGVRRNEEPDLWERVALQRTSGSTAASWRHR